MARFRPAIALLILSSPAMGQTAEPATPTPEAAYDAAVSAISRAEQLDEDVLTPADLQEINRRIVALQGAEPNHPRLPYLYGRFYALAGRGSDAIEQLRSFVETREGRNEWEAHRRLGDLFIDEFPRLAQGSYERAAELKSNEPTVLMGLSLCAYKVGRLDEAVRLAKDAADADGRKSVRVVSHLARMYIAKQQWNDAERATLQGMELAEAEIKRRPGARGPLRTLDEQYQLATDLVQARIAEKAAGADDYVRLAGYYRKRDELGSKLNLHEVVRVLERGVNATAPNTPPKLLQEYAVALAEVGRTEDAIATFEKLLAAEPANPVATQWLEKLRATKP